MAGDLTLDTPAGPRPRPRRAAGPRLVRSPRDPELWAHHVAFDDDHRVYVSLHRDAHVDVWLLCWTPENDTGWHDHDISSGAVAVVSGSWPSTTSRSTTRRIETRVEGRPGLQLRSRPHPPADRRRRTARSRSTPTARRCGGWASTPSAPTACCAASRSPTPTSCGPSTDPASASARAPRRWWPGTCRGIPTATGRPIPTSARVRCGSGSSDTSTAAVLSSSSRLSPLRHLPRCREAAPAPGTNVETRGPKGRRASHP